MRELHDRPPMSCCGGSSVVQMEVAVSHPMNNRKVVGFEARRLCNLLAPDAFEAGMSVGHRVA